MSSCRFESSQPAFFFDVFDTCITRMHAYPRDVFFDIGLRLAPKSANSSEQFRFARRFQKMRIRAEKIANLRSRRKGRDHADIDAIYENLRWLMKLTQSHDELVAAELALEEETLYPIEETISRIEVLRAEGCRIVFLSDMYIPARLLAPLLMRKGVLIDGDGLYVSCDVGGSKHSGRLFDVALTREGLRAADVIHSGDNPFVDIRMAETRGIRTHHFTSAHLLPREIAIAGRRISRSPAASWQAAFSRRCRLAVRADPETPRIPALEGLLSGVVTPFLLSYVQWVLDDARSRGIKRLYFVARDAEILLRAARELQPSGIDLRYLYGSRRAWLVPSIVPGRPQWKRLVVVAGTQSAPADIASRLGLDDVGQAELRNILRIDEAGWHTPLALERAHAFLDQLTEFPECWELVRQAISSQRLAALQYLKQEGLLDDVQWALVDAGWSLNSQAALKRILETQPDFTNEVQGYYIGLARDHLTKHESGEAFAFVQPAGSIFSRRRVVVEHTFLPPTHASTRKYVLKDAVAAPSLSNEFRSIAELTYASKAQQSVATAASMLANNTHLKTRLVVNRAQIVGSAVTFLSRPMHDEVRALASMSVVADMRQERDFALALCRPLYPKDVWATFAMTFSAKKAFSTPAWMWLEGSSAISTWTVQLPLRAMLWFDAVLNRWRSLRR